MMNQYFSQKQVNPMGKPMKELMDLNLRTLQNFKFLNPIELLQSGAPDKVLEKNVDVMVQNGHNTLDYLQHVFLIMENSMFHNFSNLVEESEQVVKQAQTTVKRNVKKVIKAADKTVSKKKTPLKKKSVKLSALKAKVKTKAVASKPVKKSTKPLKAKSTVKIVASKTPKVKSVKTSSKPAAKNLASIVKGSPKQLPKKLSKVTGKKKLSTGIKKAS